MFKWAFHISRIIKIGYTLSKHDALMDLLVLFGEQPKALERLRKFNIKYERFNAISRPDFGIIGCTQSHLEIIKMAKQNNYKNILILEDDFTFTVSKDKFEVGSKSYFAPPSALRALDKILAVVVLPTPLGPVNIYP